MAQDGFVKIKFHDDSGTGSESYWAEPLGDSRYKMQNIPFFVDRLNLFDVVVCQEREGDLPTIIDVVEQSGHRTILLRLAEPTLQERWDFSQDLWKIRNQPVFDGLIDLGVTWEKGGDRQFALDVPPETDYEAVMRILRDGKERANLEFEEPWREIK